jgi:hypothetical protein
MQEPHVTLPAVPGGLAQRWGLGWMLFDWGDRRVIGHDGGTIGQNASLRLFPDANFGAAVLTNGSPSGGMLTARVMKWLFSECLGIAMPPRPMPPESPPAIDLTSASRSASKSKNATANSLRSTSTPARCPASIRSARRSR